ncbi:MAG TPA: hypothetical protein VG965_02415 [Patescibacteria group bacterium]|nr:hypothetical protein [Patescibacteria group bacterium]
MNKNLVHLGIGALLFAVAVSAFAILGTPKGVEVTVKPTLTPTEIVGNNGPYRIFKQNDSVFGDDIILFTGLELDPTSGACLLVKAPSGGIVHLPISDNTDRRVNPSPTERSSMTTCKVTSFKPIPLASEDGGGVSGWGVIHFRPLQDAWGFITLEDGKTFPTPCLMRGAQIGGTVRQGIVRAPGGITPEVAYENDIANLEPCH